MHEQIRVINAGDGYFFERGSALYGTTPDRYERLVDQLFAPFLGPTSPISQNELSDLFPTVPWVGDGDVTGSTVTSETGEQYAVSQRLLFVSRKQPTRL